MTNIPTPKRCAYRARSGKAGRYFGMILLFVFGAACASPAIQRPRPPIVATHTKIAILGGWITADILVPKDTEGPVPAVISPLNHGYDLLRAGIATVRFRTHWDTLRRFGKKAEGNTEEGAMGEDPAAAKKPLIGRWILAADRPGIIGQGYFGIIAYEAYTAIPAVLDALHLIPAIDPGRIGIAGSSTSGFLALQAMAHDPRLHAGFVRAATGDYRCFLRYSDLALGNDPRWLPGDKMMLDDAYTADLERIDPGNHLERFPPRTLLLITGQDDTAIPAHCVERFAGALQAAYLDAAMPDRFTWVELEDVGHNLPPETLDAARSFWRRTFSSRQ